MSKAKKLKDERKRPNNSVLKILAMVILSAVFIAALVYSYSKWYPAKDSPKNTATEVSENQQANVTSQNGIYKTGERQYSKAPDMVIDTSKTYLADFETSDGNFQVELDAKNAPKTVNNFVVLAKDKFYDGLTFHRIVKDFMVQGGDPKGDGTGGPGYTFDDELPTDQTYTRGTIAMANSGPNTNGSQFFIMHKDNVNLPKNYSIFGHVISGIETIDKIAETDVTDSPSGERSQPVDKVIIQKVTIEEK